MKKLLKTKASIKRRKVTSIKFSDEHVAIHTKDGVLVLPCCDGPVCYTWDMLPQEKRQLGIITPTEMARLTMQSLMAGLEQLCRTEPEKVRQFLDENDEDTQP